MVRVMSFALEEGKVAVHCHAGLGRTGVLIASYLLFSERISPDSAIKQVRDKRPGSIQTRNQIEFIRQFARYLEPLRIIYASVAPSHYQFTLRHYMDRQRQLLHGYEARRLKMIPKIIYLCCENLLHQVGRGDPDISSDHLPHHHRISLLQTSASTKMTRSMSACFPSDHVTSASQLANSVKLEQTGEEEDLMRPRVNSFGFAGRSNPMCEKIAIAMSQTDVETSVKHQAEKIQISLNTDNKGWKLIQSERNISLLAALLWDWLEHLKEPVLTKQDLRKLLIADADVRVCLREVSACSRHVVEYLCGVMTRLHPITSSSHRNLLDRLVTALTHSQQPARLPSFTPVEVTSKEMQQRLREVLDDLIKHLKDNLHHASQIPQQEKINS